MNTRAATAADVSKVRIHNRGNPVNLPGRRHTGTRIEVSTTLQHRGKPELSDRVCVGLHIEHGGHIDLPRWYVEDLKAEPGIARPLAAGVLVLSGVDEAPPPREKRAVLEYNARKAHDVEQANQVAAAKAETYAANARIAELEAQLEAKTTKAKG